MSGATGEDADPMSVAQGNYGLKQAFAMEGGKTARTEILKRVMGGAYPSGGPSASNVGFMRSLGGII